MTQAFYRKWRPQRWDQVVGQEHIIKTLENTVIADRVAHAYLFAGPRGTGKTTTARLLAKAVNCLDPDLAKRPCDQCSHCLAVSQGRFLDLIEIDAASNTSVEDVRDLRDKINFSPNQGRFKVYIVDEVHMLSTAAFNALLKTLEEPPSHAMFILATTEVHKIPATVLSRCQRHEFRRIPVAEIASHLTQMVRSENIQVDDDALLLVARQATGSLRDAISLLDQLASAGTRITLDFAHSVLGTAASQAVLDIINAYVDKDAARGLDLIHTALDTGADPRQFARQIVDYLRSLLLIKMKNADQVEATTETRAHMARHAHYFSTPRLLEVIQIFNRAALDAKVSWQPALPLELAFIAALEVPAQESVPAGREDRGIPAVPASPKPAPEKKAKTQVAESFKQPSKEEPGAELEERSTETLESITIETVNQRWKQVLKAVRQRNPQTQGLLHSCRPLGLKNGALVLGFNSDFSKAKMEKAEHLDITSQVLNEVFGMEVPIRCIVAAGKKGSPPPNIDSDGMVATALRDLDGEIVDIQ
jgi:DNA polymerase III subunit gamma/tau